MNVEYLIKLEIKRYLMDINKKRVKMTNRKLSTAEQMENCVVVITPFSGKII